VPRMSCGSIGSERLLADVIGLDWAFVHDEACRWEHVMSEQVERRIIDMLGHPTQSPYGNPIPGLDELGDSPAERFLDGVRNIVTATEGTDAIASGVVRRLGEPVQFEPELLHQLRLAGVMPGRVAHVQRAGAYVSVRVEGEEAGLELPVEVAQHVYIDA